jgi:hypothetical protein
MKSDQCFLQSAFEKAKIDAWLSEWVLPHSDGCDCPKHGVEQVVSSESAGGAQYRVRCNVGRRKVDFGTFVDA